jgi:hypothetical protein
MTKATGWQQHSVRGFLAGVLRKRLKLKLGSKKVDGNRVYRIAGGDGRKSGPRQPKHRPERHAARKGRSCAGSMRPPIRGRSPLAGNLSERLHWSQADDTVSKGSQFYGNGVRSKAPELRRFRRAAAFLR